jgi:hypothetical protein
MTRTRIRFTDQAGKPITYEAGGGTHTMDRIMHVVSDREGRCQIDCRAHYLHHLLSLETGIPYSEIQVHLDPLTGPSAQGPAELATLLGDV